MGKILGRQWLDEGTQLRIQTSAGVRIVDILVTSPDGTLESIEVKSGAATRTAAQVTKDDLIATEGGAVSGRRAPEELKGETIIIQTRILPIK